MSTPLPSKVQAAAQAGQLLPSTVENLTAWWQGGLPAWAQQSIAELIEREQWSELNDRFYRYLEFGTGGMRGRTIGAVAAKAETGTLSASGSPEHAGVGANMLNDFTLVRAVVGLHRYVAKYLASQKSTTSAIFRATSANSRRRPGRVSAARPISSTARAPRRSLASPCAG
jgi:phosphoglucomutase